MLLGDMACNSTMEYESVCGNGVLKALSGEDKTEALRVLMNQYQNGKKHEFDNNEILAVEILELVVDEINGKRLKKQAVI